MKTFTQKAVYAALAGASLTLASTASAVNINNDGLGEALLYPYYTVRNGQATLMSVVNTTNQAKAVKVRFIEGKNSAEVLDFNLWLSPQDVWTGAIIATADGAAIATADKSCTNPKITGSVPFRNTAYAGLDNSTLGSLDRTREGYIEVIEMATVVEPSNTFDDVLHDSTGTPTCKLVNNAAVRANITDYRFPVGGLFGNGTIVGASMSTGYNATALQGLDYQKLVTDSGTVFPNLNSGLNTTAVIVDSPAPTQSRITAANFILPIDAVSAVMMHSSVIGEYTYDATFGTDWVITMPTKRFYVNPGLPTQTVALPPFQRPWNGRVTGQPGTASVDISIASYDREEQSSVNPDDFSPTGEAGVPILPWETTIVSFGPSGTTGPSAVVGSTNTTHFNGYQKPGAAGGWGELTFGSSSFTPQLGALNTSQTTTVSSGGVIGTAVVGPVTFVGLPAIGFSIVSAKFATTSDNFNSSYNLNFRRTIR
jgi:hypothetical protein